MSTSIDYIDHETSYGLQTDERTVTTFTPVYFQIQAFKPVAKMLVYICLVMVTLIAPSADSAICVFPDQYELTLQDYEELAYYNVSMYITRRMMAATRYLLQEDLTPVVSGRIVFDYNVLNDVDFVLCTDYPPGSTTTRVLSGVPKVFANIPPPAPFICTPLGMKGYAIINKNVTWSSCTSSKIKDEILSEIPDDAVEVPLQDELTPSLPSGTRFWRFKRPEGINVILGVLSITSEVCAPLVFGKSNKDDKLIRESVAYNLGKYSLSIRNMSVFDVPPHCPLLG